MPTQQQIELFGQIAKGSLQRDILDQRAEHDPELAKNLKYIDRHFSGLNRGTIFINPLVTSDKNTVRALQEWDAADALKKRATELSGSVTPESMVGAQTSLINEIRAQERKDPKNALYPAMEIKLRKTFQEEVAALSLAETQPAAAKQIVWRR